MKAEDKIQILKFFLMVFNGVFVILGLAIFGCGVWILFDKSSFIVTLSGGSSMKTVAGGLFVIGLVVFGVSCLGYVGAYKEIRFLLMLYMGFLIVIFLGQLFVTFVLLIKRKEITNFLIEEVDQIIVTYGTMGNGSSEQWRVLDAVQHHSNCCGRTGYTQWRNNTFISSLSNGEDVYPCSCFNTSCPFLSGDTSLRFGNGSSVFQKGCQESIEVWLSGNGLAILGMDAGLVLIQILQFVLSLYLIRNIRRKAKQKRLLNNQEDNSAVNDGYQHLD
ncbi:CD82 antigen [Megalops cyprinoides]|uniref:CD82 antigen n=1 Tax=Megalops cyprinoides TaxID=118141 RepID=UPI001864EFE7|nr:CD82 antigen [Megalops cyprinoides]